MNQKFNIVFASKMNVHNRRTEILNSYLTLYKEYAFSVRSIWMYAQVSVKFTLISCVLFFVKKTMQTNYHLWSATMDTYIQIRRTTERTCVNPDMILVVCS